MHEAGHAVQAMVNGLGVAFASVDPPVVRTARQAELESEGHQLGNPSTLPDELVEFYWKDIEVRVAGPLASYRDVVEREGRSLAEVDPTEIPLWMYGGASTGEKAGDEAVALRAATILSRHFNLVPQPYVDHVIRKVWRETILDDHRWNAIRRLGEALDERGVLTTAEVAEVVGGLSAQAGSGA